MSIRVMTTVWDESAHTGTALLAMLALADRANDDGYCYPGIASIAAKVRIKERQCTNVIQTLEASGELFVDRGVGRHGTSKYLILIGLSEIEIIGRLIHYFGCPKKDAPVIAHRLFEKVQRITPFNGQSKKVQSSVEKVQPLTVKGAIQRRKGAIAIAPDPSVSIIDTSLIHQFAATAAPIQPNETNLSQVATEQPPTQMATPEPVVFSPLQQSPIDDDVPPAPPPIDSPKAPRPRNIMFDKIAALTHTTSAMAGKQIGGLMKNLKADNYTDADIDRFAAWWCQDWRSRGDAVPTVGQIGQLFGVAMAWADKHAPKAPLAAEPMTTEDAEALWAAHQAREAELDRRRDEARANAAKARAGITAGHI